MAPPGGTRPARGLRTIAGLLVAVVLLAVLWGTVAAPFRTDGDASEGAGRQVSGLRAEATRRGDRARLTVTGIAPVGTAPVAPAGTASAGTAPFSAAPSGTAPDNGGPIVVRVLGRTDAAAPCPTPQVRPSGALVLPPDSTRVGWSRLAGRVPGRPLSPGAAFEMSGTVALRSAGAMRLCVYLARAGARPAILRTVRTVVPSRRGLTPLTVVLEPAVDAFVVPALKVLAVLLAGLVAGWAVVVGGRRVRLVRSAEVPSPLAGWTASAWDLPPLPDDVHVPDVLPWLAGDDVVGPGPRDPRGPDDVPGDPGPGGERTLAPAVPRVHQAPRAPAPEPQNAAPEDPFVLLARSYPGVRLLSARREPFGGRPTIDHVLIGPAGVTVVATRRWAGTVRVAEERLFVRGLDRTRAVDVLCGQVSAVRALLSGAGLGAVPVSGVLLWSRSEGTALDGSVALRGVPLLDASGTLLRAVDGGVLGREGVRRVGGVLEGGLPPAR